MDHSENQTATIETKVEGNKLLFKGNWFQKKQKVYIYDKQNSGFAAEIFHIINENVSISGRLNAF